MKSIIITVIGLLGLVIPPQSTIYRCSNVKTTLFSEAPLENIEATSAAGVSIIDMATGEVMVSLPVKSFQFKKGLMQEHFNENYMESDKFPRATFKGIIAAPLPPLKDGDYPISVSGELDVHGVKQSRTVKGTLTVRGQAVSVVTSFDVQCKDHGIKIPTMVFKNIAETIRITASASYAVYSSKR